MKRKFQNVLVLLATAGILSATTYAPTTLQQFAAGATNIVTAKVEQVNAAWDESHSKIYTYITVKIETQIKGDNLPQFITIRQLGGQVGEEALVIHSAPEFQVGEKVLLFLTFHRGEYWIHSLGMGKFDIITEEGETVAVNRQVGADLLKTDQSKLQVLNAGELKFRLDDLISRLVSFTN